jgi:uncharacterized protein (TIGR00288 family)
LAASRPKRNLIAQVEWGSEMQASLRLALLIDAENVSHNLAGRIFDLVMPLGNVQVRRIYGDFKGQAASWDEAARRHALDARHCFSPATGKNGSDIRLALDAMELVNAGGIDAVCVVSSDGDFAVLAQKVREAGRLVYGIGRTSTTKGYRESCDEFFCLDDAAAVVATTPTPHAALPLIRQALAKCTSRDGWYHLGAFGIEARKAGLLAKNR